jgi:uncharacterized membrane protein YdcZ (DUF606 family)
MAASVRPEIINKTINLLIFQSCDVLGAWLCGRYPGWLFVCWSDLISKKSNFGVSNTTQHVVLGALISGLKIGEKLSISHCINKAIVYQFVLGILL